jgi:TusA-related sulfurtransferase
LEKNYVSKQTQPGKYAVLVPFVNGNTKAETLISIADFAAEFGNDVLRFTPRQQLQFRNLPEAYLGNLFLLLKQLNINISESLLVNNVVSCTGADTCRLGICYSKGAASALRRKLSKSALPLDEIKDLKINISGCPNSCAQHRWSDIGFSGKVARNGRMYPAYSVFAGAQRGEKGKLGEPVGTVSAKDLPNFVEEVLSAYLSTKHKYVNFSEYVREEGSHTLVRLMEKYTDVPKFDEDNNYYFDWGSEQLKLFELYENMDDSLQFKNIPAVKTKEPDTAVTTKSAINTKDLRGVACPMNFVRTKLELSRLNSGDLLEVWLDDGQPIQNVPGSVRKEGHEIKSVTQGNNFWKVLIKKA